MSTRDRWGSKTPEERLRSRTKSENLSASFLGYIPTAEDIPARGWSVISHHTVDEEAQEGYVRISEDGTAMVTEPRDISGLFRLFARMDWLLLVYAFAFLMGGAGILNVTNIGFLAQSLGYGTGDIVDLATAWSATGIIMRWVHLLFCR